MALKSCMYTDNGVKKEFDHESYVKELKANHYKDLKRLIRIAIGNRTQAQFAHETGMSKEYLSRILKENSDILPSISKLEVISKHSENNSVSIKELAIAAGRTPACERLDSKALPTILSREDVNVNHVYLFKKDLTELLISERGRSTCIPPEDYIKELMKYFISECRYTYFDFECFISETVYEKLDDWGIDSRFSPRNIKGKVPDRIIIGYCSAAVRKKFEPQEWVVAKVPFAIFFTDKDDDNSYEISDTDWDLPDFIMDEPEFKQIDIPNTYSLKDFLNEEPTKTYITEELDRS